MAFAWRLGYVFRTELERLRSRDFLDLRGEKCWHAVDSWSMAGISFCIARESRKSTLGMRHHQKGGLMIIEGTTFGEFRLAVAPPLF
jgi:hypothetical protein